MPMTHNQNKQKMDFKKKFFFSKVRLLNPSKSETCIFLYMNGVKNEAGDFMYHFTGLNCFENMIL